MVQVTLEEAAKRRLQEAKQRGDFIDLSSK
jgi:hypothetical protein